MGCCLFSLLHIVALCCTLLLSEQLRQGELKTRMIDWMSCDVSDVSGTCFEPYFAGVLPVWGIP